MNPHVSQAAIPEVLLALFVFIHRSPKIPNSYILHGDSITLHPTSNKQDSLSVQLHSTFKSNHPDSTSSPYSPKENEYFRASEALSRNLVFRQKIPWVICYNFLNKQRHNSQSSRDIDSPLPNYIYPNIKPHIPTTLRLQFSKKSQFYDS